MIFLVLQKIPAKLFCRKRGSSVQIGRIPRYGSFFRRQKPLFQAVGEGEGHLTLREVDGHGIPLDQPDLPGAEGLVENPVARLKRPGGDHLLEKPPEDAPPGLFGRFVEEARQEPGGGEPAVVFSPGKRGSAFPGRGWRRHRKDASPHSRRGWLLPLLPLSAGGWGGCRRCSPAAGHGQIPAPWPSGWWSGGLWLPAVGAGKPKSFPAVRSGREGPGWSSPGRRAL